jgi:8-oxo-dGTP diphosphatase
MKHLTTINLENIDEDQTEDYEARRAARAVVFDEKDCVALLPVSKHNYYKLPGGGIEEGEDIPEAVKRECLEEIGCEIEIVQEIGEIHEFRPKNKFKQTSYCYIAKTSGAKGEPAFTESEQRQGFLMPVWVPIAEAIGLVENNTPDNYNGPYIVKRDGTFLKKAQSIWNKTSDL